MLLTFCQPCGHLKPMSFQYPISILVQETLSKLSSSIATSRGWPRLRAVVLSSNLFPLTSSQRSRIHLACAGSPHSLSQTAHKDLELTVVPRVRCCFSGVSFDFVNSICSIGRLKHWAMGVRAYVFSPSEHCDYTRASGTEY